MFSVMATRAMNAKHNPKHVARRRQNDKLARDLKQSRKSGNRTHAHLQKDDSILRTIEKIIAVVPLPDDDWKQIPFADADVPSGELQSAKDAAVMAMQQWGVLVEASRESGIGRDRLKHYLRTDDLFKQRMRAAKVNNDEKIERELRRRGQIKGGELAGIYITKHNIKKYREIQRLELTGRGGGPVAYTEAKAELLKRLESLALKSQATDAIVVGEKPRLIKGGSDAEGPKVKHVEKGKGWKVESKR